MIVYPESGYESWLSEAEADAYFATRLNVDEWTAATSDLKLRALQTAFRSLQEFAFEINFDADGTLADTYSDEHAEAILKALQESQCEQALHELKHDLENLTANSVSLGGLLSVKLSSDAKPERYSPRAVAILRPLIKARAVSRYR
ncbi:MAG: hypothetical protein KQI62_09455 [Deltaproteobacteria bacterium]|nr:hypothetical protein [Deltaproteobacteria bacterium]